MPLHTHTQTHTHVRTLTHMCVHTHSTNPRPLSPGAVQAPVRSEQALGVPCAGDSNLPDEITLEAQQWARRPQVVERSRPVFESCLCIMLACECL